MKILAWFRNFFEGSEGESSSKRLTAFLCLATAIYCAIVNKDVANAGAFLGATVALLGVSAFTKS